MSKLTRITTEQAIAVLCEDAAGNPTLVQAKFAEALQRDPTGINALLKAASIEAMGDVVAAAAAQPKPLVIIGQPVKGAGIPIGQLNAGNNTVNLEIVGFLAARDGKMLELTGDQAIDAITALNGGVKYGNGYEKAVARAVAKGEFKDGTLILARQADLLKIARERETNPALKQINGIVASGSNVDSWCVSSTEGSDFSSHVSHVSLKAGFGDWYSKDSLRSRVVVLRGAACG